MVRCYSFMTSTKKGGGVITKFWVILQMVADGAFRNGDFSGTLDLHKSKKQISSFSS